MKNFKEFLNEEKQELNESASGDVEVEIKDGVVSGVAATYTKRFSGKEPTIDIRLRGKYGKTPEIEISLSSGHFENSRAAEQWVMQVAIVEETFKELMKIKSGMSKENAQKHIDNIKGKITSLGLKIYID